jgi:hypothetical protein
MEMELRLCGLKVNGIYSESFQEVNFYNSDLENIRVLLLSFGKEIDSVDEGSAHCKGLCLQDKKKRTRNNRYVFYDY